MNRYTKNENHGKPLKNDTFQQFVKLSSILSVGMAGFRNCRSRTGSCSSCFILLVGFGAESGMSHAPSSMTAFWIRPDLQYRRTSSSDTPQAFAAWAELMYFIFNYLSTEIKQLFGTSAEHKNQIEPPAEHFFCLRNFCARVVPELGQDCLDEPIRNVIKN